MRRGLWLAAGAVLGVAGYRRATRMVEGLTRGVAGDAARSPAHRRAARVSRPTADGHGAAGRPAVNAASIGAAADFVRDVRDGVAEYLDLHHRELARNLGGRRNRTPSG
jgi:hypothetical protein